MITLSWRKHRFDGLGEGFMLEGFSSKDDNGCARPHAALHYVAIAHIGGNFISYDGNTLDITVKKLNADINRRFGDRMQVKPSV